MARNPLLVFPLLYAVAASQALPRKRRNLNCERELALLARRHVGDPFSAAFFARLVRKETGMMPDIWPEDDTLSRQRRAKRKAYLAEYEHHLANGPDLPDDDDDDHEGEAA